MSSPTTTVATSWSGRIPGLDGLRAIAVGLVLVYHLWPTVLPGGFSGVDVFFVLSGFLITTRLIVELRTAGEVDLRAFWLRRARRLLPALALVALTSTALALLIDRDLLVDIGRQLVGAATFSTNWLEVAAGTDYFAATDDQLLTPLWSLAVEEQFYLIWPMVFVALAVRNVDPRRSTAISLSVAGISAVLMAVLLGSPDSATRVYYGTDTHVFGLMIGVALAYVFADLDSFLHGERWLATRRWLGFVGLALLVLLVPTLGTGSGWTYRGGLLAVSLATAIIIAALPGPDSALIHSLSGRTLRWIGRRSYGIYLWHWPILLLVRAWLPARAPGANADLQTAVIVLIATFAISAASFRFVEVPIQRNGYRATFRRWMSPTPDADETGARAGEGAQVAGIDVRRILAPVALGGLVVLAMIGAVTAPSATSAQASVEEGLRIIAAQDAAAEAASQGDATATDPVAPLSDAIDGSATPPNARPLPTPLSLPTPVGQVSTVDDGDASVAESPGAEAPAAAPTSVAVEPAPTTAVPAPTAAQPSPPAPAPPAAPSGSTLDGTRIVGIGDSVMSGAAPAMLERFPGIRIKAAASKQWGDAAAMIRDVAAQGDLRPVVVLNFGTNAGLADDDRIQSFYRAIDAIGPDHQVILVTIVGISHWIPESNENLKVLASRYPNVTVVDWNAAVQADPSLLHGDRTHPNLRGIAVYADLIAQAIR